MAAAPSFGAQPDDALDPHLRRMMARLVGCCSTEAPHCVRVCFDGSV
jgi:hypothetical protein